MDQDGTICRCMCHCTFLGEPPEWTCYCNCHTGKRQDVKQPYKCPVCEGSRYDKPELKTVKASMTIDGIECKTGNTIYWKSICGVCQGKGVLWR